MYVNLIEDRTGGLQLQMHLIGGRPRTPLWFAFYISWFLDSCGSSPD